jgi:hypothetical protein
VGSGLLLDVVVRRLDLEGDGLAREGLDEGQGRTRTGRNRWTRCGTTG